LSNTYFQDCVLVIPTRNRSKYIETVLRFYSLYEIKPKLVIADSSDLSELNANRKLVEKFRSRLDIDHLEFDKDIPVVNKLYECISYINSSFVGLVADDDYLSLDVALKCLDFLRESEDYVFCTGSAAIIYGDKIHGRAPDKVTFSDQITSGSPVERLREYSECKRQKMYGIHRRVVLEAALGDTLRLIRRPLDIFAEHFIYMSIVARGRTACLTEVALLFVKHVGNASYDVRALDLPVSGQDTYSAQVDLAVELLQNCIIKRSHSQASASLQNSIRSHVRATFEGVRADGRQFRKNQLTYKLIAIALFPVKALCILLDRLGIKKRTIVNSPDELFNLKMQRSNSSLNQFFIKISSVN
jgi:glycosyltransferase domain-containing protein